MGEVEFDGRDLVLGELDLSESLWRRTRASALNSSKSEMTYEDVVGDTLLRETARVDTVKRLDVLVQVLDDGGGEDGRYAE